MRKTEVFLWAALHAAPAERTVFLERATFFFRGSLRTLQRLPGRHYTRPLVVLLSNGVRQAWFVRQPALPDPQRPPRPRWQSPTPFTPQKVMAVGRAKRLAASVVAAGILLAGWLLSR